MKVLVTGATGFIGNHLVMKLQEQGHHVYALVRRSSSYNKIEAMGVKLIFGTLEDVKVDGVWPALDAVIHVGGLIKSKTTEGFYKTNTEGTIKLFESLKNLDLKHFVFVSSISARGPFGEAPQPTSHYGRSK